MQETDQTVVTIEGDWQRLFAPSAVGLLEPHLAASLKATRWFGGKARTIVSTRVEDTVALRLDAQAVVLLFVDVAYADGGRDRYVMPVTAAFDEGARAIEQASAHAILCAILVTGGGRERRGLLYDALFSPECAAALLRAIGKGTRFPGNTGTLVASPTGAFAEAVADPSGLTPSVMKGEQSNTSVKFGRRAILKLYRRFEGGMNPDLEIGRALTARKFPHTPALLGAVEWERSAGEPATVAILQGFMENKGDAWQYTLGELEQELSRLEPGTSVEGEPAARSYAESAATLGRRTGELHVALSHCTDDPAFAPEPCSARYWESLRDRMQQSIRSALGLLRERRTDLGTDDRRRADQVLALEDLLLGRVRMLTDRPPTTSRMRCHGDYHLGQVLYTGRDFVIIDFEGEPARPLAERRAKHVPIVDVAGMIRSFHYAAYVALEREEQRRPAGERPSGLEGYLVRWYESARSAFLTGYAAVAERAAFWPASEEERSLLLDAHLIEKALYELSYELNNRPTWVGVPLRGILQLVGSREAGASGSGRHA